MRNQVEAKIQNTIIDDISKTANFRAKPVDPNPRKEGQGYNDPRVLGFPDLVVLCRERFMVLFLEVKQPGKKLSKRQEAWHEDCQYYNHFVRTVHSVEEALLALDEFCKLTHVRDIYLQAMLRAYQPAGPKEAGRASKIHSK